MKSGKLVVSAEMEEWRLLFLVAKSAMMRMPVLFAKAQVNKGLIVGSI